MEYYAGLDVSLESTSVCIVDGGGRIVRETKIASEPEALVSFLRTYGVPMARIGLEAGPLSQWLYAGLTAEGLPAELIETRHVRAAFKVDDGEDGSDGCARHRAADAAWLVPAGALQVAAGAGGSGAFDGAQTSSGKAP